MPRLRRRNPARNLRYLDHSKVFAKGRGAMPGIPVDMNAALTRAFLAYVKTNGITAIQCGQVRATGFG